jgi:hypothetical protein
MLVKTRSAVYHMIIRTGKLPLVARVCDWNVTAVLELMVRMDRFAGQEEPASQDRIQGTESEGVHPPRMFLSTAARKRATSCVDDG